MSRQRVLATRVWFIVVYRLEGQSSTDLELTAAGRYRRRRGRRDDGTCVPVSLAGVGAARHCGPRQRVELGRVEAEHVASMNSDQLMGHQRQFLEAKFSRPEECLTNECVVAQHGGRRMLVTTTTTTMMMMMRMLTDTTVKLVHRSPHLHRCTNNVNNLQPPPSP